MQYFVYKLTELRRSLRNRETGSIDAARKDLVNSSLLHYLDCWRNVEVHGEKAQHGWLYILSTRDQPNMLKIGTTNRTVPERVKEINSATGVLYPFSARAVYKVKDARVAERRIFQLLSDYRIRQDREFFEVPFSKAAKLIEEELFSERALKREQGTVAWFNENKVYGFIQYAGEKKIFVHITEVLDEDIKSLEQGQEVRFDVKPTRKGQAATRIVVVGE
jgi:cold shock CspA family protein